MRFISRSSHEHFSECQRKGYWGYIYAGGLEEATAPWPLVIGLAVHKGMEKLMLGESIDEAIEWLNLEFSLKGEQGPVTEEWLMHKALAEALVRGWRRARFERFMERFEILKVEEEWLTKLAANLGLKSRIDVVVRDRITGFIYVIDWKTSSSIKDWSSQWEDEILVLTQALTTQEQMGEEVAGVIFEGLYKGGKYKGQYTSPLVRGYRLLIEGGEGEAPRYVYSHDKRKDYEQFQVWKDFPGGIAAWIDWLPLDVVENQFISSPTILKHDDMIRDWLVQVVRRETDIEALLTPEVPEGDRLSYFWQNKGSQCRWCHFRPACRWEISIDGMLEAGLLRVREDHHVVKEEEDAGNQDGGVA